MSAENIYGNEKFLAKDARVHVQSLIGTFKDYFLGLGYEEVPSVKISSGIDPTVRLVGSHISVLKPYLTNNNVPEPGVYIHQNCIRTKNATRLLEDDFLPAWGSYFPSIGALVPPNRLESGSNDAFNFFEDVLKIPHELLLIRISSKDKDLSRVVNKRFSSEKIEVDSKDFGYYRHKIGMPGIWGRNFNIALRKPNSPNEYSDVGNIILIENAEQQLGIEIALGTTTILKELYGLDHVQDCTPVEGIDTNNEAIRRKMEDAVIVCSVLFDEGVRPSDQHNRNRILKKYVNALSYFRGKLEISLENLEGIVSNFISTQLTEVNPHVSKSIVESVKYYEENLKSKENLAKGDEKLITALGLDLEL